MLSRLIGFDSPVGMLRSGLDASSREVKRIGHRVANALDGVQGGDFQRALDAAEQGRDAQDGTVVDLETEMVHLADAQLRYEATTRLLQKVYQNIRASIREG
ncbi:MAG: hypothetical protein D6701_06670 [Gemmatimonadetes bacterium]|nr:MAG: hypothetical protein D6701_06670 [Gemmatimonadota bacterium]